MHKHCDNNYARYLLLSVNSANVSEIEIWIKYLLQNLEKFDLYRISNRILNLMPVVHNQNGLNTTTLVGNVLLSSF